MDSLATGIHQHQGQGIRAKSSADPRRSTYVEVLYRTPTESMQHRHGQRVEKATPKRNLMRIFML